jgi:ribosomal protein S18
VDPSISSTETLLRNIQGLLKVAADNARQQERQINYEKSEYIEFAKIKLLYLFVTELFAFFQLIGL